MGDKTTEVCYIRLHFLKFLQKRTNKFVLIINYLVAMTYIARHYNLKRLIITFDFN